jgi:membrane protease YdiL (CAAX protease family)
MSTSFLSHLLFAFALTVEPAVFLKAFLKLRGTARPTWTRTRFYCFALAMEWAWVAAVGLLVFLGAFSLEDIGLRSPEFTSLGKYSIAFALVLILAPLLAFVLAVRNPSTKEKALEVLRKNPVTLLFPRTSSERWLWILVSLTAGICEEILYRGFIFSYLATFFQLPVLWAILVSAIVFGLSHVYQGTKGIFGTAVVGIVFGVIYLTTGSLFVSIALHVLLDLRGLVVVRTLGESKT